VGATLAAGAVIVAGCGSSAATSNLNSAAASAYDKAGNALCKAAVVDIAPVTKRMAAVEKNKVLPTLADTKALDAAQATLQENLAKLPAPPSLKTEVAQANAAYAAVVARVQQLLKQHGDESIAYDAVDPQLGKLSTTLETKLKAAGLSSCE